VTVNEKQIPTGTITTIYSDWRVVVLLIMDREENGLLDPLPRMVIFYNDDNAVTQPGVQTDLVRTFNASQLANLPTVDSGIAANVGAYEKVTVFGKKIAFQRTSVEEGAWAGVTIFFHDVYLVKE
jgi:hypothetical protein